MGEAHPVADQVLAALARGRFSPEGTPRESRLVLEALRGAARSATRFYLDADATGLMSELGTLHLDLLYAQLSRARPPFDRLLLDYDVRAFIEGTGRAVVAPDAPARAAVLVERQGGARFTVTPVGVSSGGKACLNATRIACDLEAPVGESPDHDTLLAAVKGCALQRGVQIMLADGTMRAADPGSLDLAETLAAAPFGTYATDSAFKRSRHARLQAHFRYELTPACAGFWRARMDQGWAQVHVGSSIFEFAGTAKLVVGALTMLNAHDLHVGAPWRVPGERQRLVGGTVVPFLEHRLISLKLPRPQARAQVVRHLGDYLPRRRHGVMGHWRHRHGAGLEEGCDHVFVSETEDRQLCALCGYDRWWVNEHERGDAALGYVTKDYQLGVK